MRGDGIPNRGDGPTTRDSGRHRHQGAGYSESLKFVTPFYPGKGSFPVQLGLSGFFLRSLAR